MTFHDYPEADSLAINLSGVTSTDSGEVAPGVILDFDAASRLVGIDLQNARPTVNLSRVAVGALPPTSLSVGRLGGMINRSSLAALISPPIARRRGRENGEAARGW